MSDTHRGARVVSLPNALLRGLEGCDLIFHAGDVTASWVLEALGQIAPVRVVRGNNDWGDWAREALDELFFVSGPFTLGLMHGHIGRGTARANTLGRMRGLVDCAIYGHSHKPDNTLREGLRMVNPGSPTQHRWEPFPTYGILAIGAEMTPRILRLD